MPITNEAHITTDRLDELVKHLGYREVAGKLGISRGTIWGRLKKAGKQMNGKKKSILSATKKQAILDELPPEVITELQENPANFTDFATLPISDAFEDEGFSQTEPQEENDTATQLEPTRKHNSSISDQDLLAKVLRLGYRKAALELGMKKRTIWSRLLRLRKKEDTLCATNRPTGPTGEVMHRLDTQVDILWKRMERINGLYNKKVGIGAIANNRIKKAMRLKSITLTDNLEPCEGIEIDPRRYGRAEIDKTLAVMASHFVGWTELLTQKHSETFHPTIDHRELVKQQGTDLCRITLAILETLTGEPEPDCENSAYTEQTANARAKLGTTLNSPQLTEFLNEITTIFTSKTSKSQAAVIKRAIQLSGLNNDPEATITVFQRTNLQHHKVFNRRQLEQMNDQGASVHYVAASLNMRPDQVRIEEATALKKLRQSDKVKQHRGEITRLLMELAQARRQSDDNEEHGVKTNNYENLKYQSTVADQTEDDMLDKTYNINEDIENED